MLYGFEHQTFKTAECTIVRNPQQFPYVLQLMKNAKKELKIFFTTIDISHNYKENKYIMYVQQQSKI